MNNADQIMHVEIQRLNLKHLVNSLSMQHHKSSISERGFME